MTYTIENEYLKVSAKSQGAELTSIFNKITGKEMLWEGNPEFWGRHAPVLFPFVGKLNNNSYTYNGKSFAMGQHGFARDMDFELVDQSENKIQFSLNSSQESKENYPFDFELILGYELAAETIIHTYEIKNSGTTDMLYSIGAHPAYNIEGEFSEYELLFEKPEPHLQRTYLQSGLLDTQKPYTLNNERILPLNHQLFAEDALVFENLESDKITLVRNEEKVLSMNFKGFPFFGIWTKPGAPFLCLEPWLGIADVHNFNGDLSEKKGVMTLKADDKINFDYSVSFY